jgi:hypothetical protein
MHSTEKCLSDMRRDEPQLPSLTLLRQGMNSACCPLGQWLVPTTSATIAHVHGVAQPVSSPMVVLSGRRGILIRQGRRATRWRLLGGGYLVAAALASASVVSSPNMAAADQGGVSFWVPGQFGSLAAVPQTPGWALAIVNYYTSVAAGGSVAAAREITIGNLSPTVNVNLNAHLNSNADVVFINPSYVFASPIFGGQFAVGMTGIAGVNNTAINGTLTVGSGSVAIERQGTLSDSMSGYGDLYPLASLRWNSGVNNWMTYVTGDIPVGMYDSASLSNLGIGHGAIDAGGGYTYLDPHAGHEFSAVTGFTYNLTNPITNYQNGVDWHLDWGASQFLTKQVLVGAVGYVYDQISCDGGSGDHVGCFESRVLGVGPQIGYIFPIGTTQAFLGVKAYWEFDAQNRPSGWNAWVTLSFSPSALLPTNPRSAMVTK